jgi:hypothetical protein
MLLNGSSPGLARSQVKSAILFTGIIHAAYFDTILRQSASLDTENILKVACIWENEKSEYVQALNDHHFVVVKSALRDQEYYVPQFIPIVDGLHFLQKHYPEIEFVLRTRLDVISSDYGKYMNLIRDIYLKNVENVENKITVITGIETHNVFFLDIIVGGRFSEMCLFYPRCDSSYPEKFLIENYSKKKKTFEKDDLREIFNFSLEQCKSRTIEFTWYREWDSSLWTRPHVHIIQDYCRESFIWI